MTTSKRLVGTRAELQFSGKSRTFSCPKVIKLTCSCRQSAGGASVDLYSYAYKNDPIVSALIEQSGTATSFFSPPPPNNTVAWYNASVILGCGDASAGAEAVLACIRTKSANELLNATNVEDPIQSVLGNFGPTSDGKVVFSDYDERADRGDFIQKPLLVGNNDNEAGLFRLLAFAANRTFTDLEWCLFNADVFTCPAAKTARERVSTGVDTYRYRYFGDFYNLRLTTKPSSGAWHGSELPILFQSAEDSSGAPNTPEETAISDYMQGAWAAFAKDPKRAFSKAPYGLPEYNPLSKSRDLILLPPVIYSRLLQVAVSFSSPETTPLYPLWPFRYLPTHYVVSLSY